MATSNTFDRAFLARYRRVYNTLIDVDDAYAKLRRHRRQLATIRKTLRIIRSQRANDYLGVTLLHRHFRAEPGAVFVERRFTPRARGHKTVLVTCPIPASRTPVRLAPHRFTFTGGGSFSRLNSRRIRLRSEPTRGLRMMSNFRQRWRRSSPKAASALCLASVYTPANGQ